MPEPEVLDPPGALRERLAAGSGEFLFFAVTPPRLATPPEQAQQIADVTMDRLRPLDLDGLLLYDIDDESDRTDQERPFPFLPTMDPADFLERHLTSWPTPAIVYRVVGKHAEPELTRWLSAQDPDRVLSVFVGASSSDQPVATSLRRAQQLRAAVAPHLGLGGVAIPERHTRRGDEHARLLAKQAAGCSFFVTQIVHDVGAAKNLVSDYVHACAEREVAPAPVVFTLTVVGSPKTLEFLQWLGVDVPRWMRNDLLRSEDLLAESFAQARATALDLVAYCRRLGVPFGVNVESISNRRAEIDAAVELAATLGGELRRPLGRRRAAITADEPA
ncbi:Methylenetetrahydrofolate reductase [Pseudonocardia thermophila]|uniref:Methylenetetrahydrofolate reductase n=1 Tax=Pseudonocardia thermophila TaxID=1848 RepID=A0A1M6Q947_PSETH|nr:methylenetetrahydrofolate reductase [Pseudonocardia thermophila]SHK16814.1 Methylenetetrahydrofolate reductase [Pseudonocardia thermophila]